MRPCVVVAVVLFTPWALAGQPAKLGLVSGTVVTANGGAPVANATLTITAVDGAPIRETTASDDSGRFRFYGMMAGRYNLVVSKPAFLPSSYGAPGPERRGTAIDLSGGQQVDLVLKIWRGSVITGRITDHNGNALADVNVSVFRYHGSKGQRRPDSTVMGRAVTDDRGVYRIYGLSPGGYAVMVAPDVTRTRPEAPDVIERKAGQSAPGRTAGALPERRAPTAPPPMVYATLYYPGVTAPVDAAEVELRMEAEQDGIDFQMRLVPLVTLTGTVELPDAPSFENVRATAILISRPVPLLRRQIGIDSKGEFTIVGLAPGRYHLVVRADDGPTSPRRAWAAIADVDIDEHVVAAGRVHVVLAPSPVVTGRIAFDGQAASPPGRPVTVEVRLTPRGETASLLETRTVVTADARFTLPGVIPGSYVLSGRVLVDGLPDQSWVVKSATVDGADAAEVPFDIAPGGGSHAATLVFTNRTSEIFGALREEAAGRTAERILVFVVSLQDGVAPLTAGRVKTAAPAPDGSFRVVGLLPGAYGIGAITEDAWEEAVEIASVSRLLGACTARVVIGEGEKKRVVVSPPLLLLDAPCTPEYAGRSL